MCHFIDKIIDKTIKFYYSLLNCAYLTNFILYAINYSKSL